MFRKKTDQAAVRESAGCQESRQNDDTFASFRGA
jgi:hypothetical protein